ncbi:MAG TPA: glyoxalase [Rhodobacteraceae bacterium]|nr:glyoxalase [Paracoccaceae bacterium]
MPYTTHPETRIGHVHLRVADLNRAIEFYRDVMGFELQQRFADQAAFLSAGGYHHHIGLNTWDSLGGSAALARTLAQVIAAGVSITGAADHGVSEAVYFNDPDGNGIEIYRDRAPEDWPRDTHGKLNMTNAPLDIAALLAEA